MAKREITVGSTDQTIDVFVPDSSSTVGAGLTGLVYNTASLACYYRKGATGSATQLSLATQTVGGAHSDGGFVEISSSNMPGVYRLDLSDTMVAAAGMLTLILRGATNMVPVLVEIEVVAINKFDAVRSGLTALPNAAADAAGGLPISDAGGLDLDVQLGKLVGTLATGTHNPQSGDAYARLGAPAGASVSADVAAVKVDTGNLVTRITSTLFTGITSLAEWLGLIAGKQTGNSTARTELRATGAGSGTYDETTDSTQAIRDRGDAAWITATGFSTHSAADVWAVATRVLTAGTNLSIPTAAAIADAVWDEPFADHESAGSFGLALNQVYDVDVTGITTAVETAAGKHSLAGVVMIATNASTSGSTLTAKKPSDDTTFSTYTVTSDAAADPITGVS